MESPHLAGNYLPHLEPIVTNSIVHWALIGIILTSLGLYIKTKAKFVPTSIQAIIEAIYEYIESIALTIIPTKTWKDLGWFFFILFIYLITANYMGMIPGVETIEIHAQGEKIPLIKAINTDINHTLALGVLTLVIIHGYVLFKKGPVKWLKHFFHLNPLLVLPIFIAIGILELALEPVKFFVLGLRLFGNIFAGEILIGSMLKIPGLAIPFMFFELLVGFLQAFVFMALSLTYLGLLVKEQH